MKVTLLNLRTGHYLQPTKNWRPGRDTALKFKSTVMAFAHARRFRFDGVVVHLSDSPLGRNVFLPVDVS